METRVKSSTPLYSTLAEDPDLRAIVEMFVEEMPGRIAGLLECLERSDWEALGRAAHQLKGAAGSYGFSAISPSAAEVEEAAKGSLPEEDIRSKVATLVDLCRAARGGVPE